MPRDKTLNPLKNKMVHCYARVPETDYKKFLEFCHSRGFSLGVLVRMVIMRALRDGNINFILEEKPKEVTNATTQ